jgi:nifR3 family TIM-barrel protein
MIYGFWEKLKKPFFVLAPMADVTDFPFRQIVAQNGRPDVFYTPFVSCDGLQSKGRERLIKDLYFEKTESPIVAQFFGSKPENFRKCAELAREMGFDGIDINMGCPDRKVLKQGSGIALCKTPELAKEIIKATKEGAGDLPVSVKTRLGWEKPDLEWIKAILECEIPALIIHGRTMKEMSKVPAHWDLIAEVVKMAKSYGTLVIGNGDIDSYTDGLEKSKQSGVDGLMVGRGIFHNPWLFSPKIDQEKISPKERIQLLWRHTQLFTEFWGEKKNFDTLKRFYKIYISGLDGAKELRVKLMETKNAPEVHEVIKDLI